jgi:hypothetical protein
LAYVYLHTRLDKNEPFYVGIGSDEYKYGGKYARSKHTIQRNRHWKNIVKLTDYTIDILFDNLSWEEACQKEIELIKFYGRSDLGLGPLCNLTDGGDGAIGSKHTIEQLEKMRRKVVQCTLEGEMVKVWDYARQVSEIGYSHAGIVKCCNGKVNSAYGFRWHYFGEELKPYIPPKPRKVPAPRVRFKRKVVQKNLRGEPIKIWNSFAEIEKETGLLACNVCAGCTKRGVVYGYKWEYFDENKEYNLVEAEYSKKFTSKKRIVQKTENGDVLRIWEGIAEIEKNTDFKKSHIYNCCINRHVKPTAYGYVWEYVDVNKNYEIKNLGIDCTKKLVPYGKIIQKSIDGQVIKIWDCARFIEQEIGIPRNAVYQVLGKRYQERGWNKAHGYRWSWA